MRGRARHRFRVVKGTVASFFALVGNHAKDEANRIIDIAFDLVKLASTDKDLLESMSPAQRAKFVAGVSTMNAGTCCLLPAPAIMHAPSFNSSASSSRLLDHSAHTLCFQSDRYTI